MSQQKQMEKIVNNAINGAVKTQWREDIKTKSSLTYIYPDSVSVGVGHHVWSSVHDNIHNSRRAHLKCCLLTGTCTLQSSVQTVCCKPYLKSVWTSPETRQHYLAECQPLQKPCNRFLRRFKVLQNLMLILGTWCPCVM